MKVFSFLFLILLSLSALATTSLPQNEQRAKTESKSLRRQLSRSDWELVGQAYYSRSISVAPFELQSLSVADEQEFNPDFLASLQLAPNVSVYYELTPSLHLSGIEENIVIPRKMHFSAQDDSLTVENGKNEFAMSYFLQFPPDAPDVVVLHLQTILGNPDEARIFGNLQFEGNEMHLVQMFGTNAQIRWIFKKSR